MQYIDIKVDSSGDLYINPTTGDLEAAPSDLQHQEDLLVCEPGHWKQHPTVGAGIRNHINGPTSPVLLQKIISKALEADGYTINAVEVINQQYLVDAERI